MAAQQIEFTSIAADKIFKIVADQQMPLFRIKIQGGGCMGFEYIFGLDEKISKQDFSWDIPSSHGNFKCVIDCRSFPYLREATIDFLSDANGERFTVHSKQAQTCSCNKSFSPVQQ